MIQSVKEAAGHDASQTVTPIRDRYRIRFAKVGLLRWIGHHDLQRLWERLLRRCDLRLMMTPGFHPRARISFPSALALGVEGLDEVVEIELSQSITPKELRSRLISDGQPGLEIGNVKLMAVNGGNGGGSSYSPGLNKAKHHSSDYELEIPEGYDLARIDAAVAVAAKLGSISTQRKEKMITVSVPDVFPTICRRDQFMCFTQIEIAGPSLKISDLLDALDLADLIASGAILRRTRLYLTDELATCGFQSHENKTI